MRFAFGSMATYTLRAAVRLKVIDLIGDRRRPYSEVAADAGTDPRTTNRLLRALTSLGLLTEHTPGTFSVTSTGALLDSRHPHSLAHFMQAFTEPSMMRGWEKLDDSVRTGETAFDALFGTDFFSYLSRHPEQSRDFNAAMSQATAATAAALPHAYDFGRYTSITDVGGGNGTLLARILDAHPGLTGTVYDSADGLAEAPRTLEQHKLTDRCSLITGDFFRSVPEGSQLYLMKSILHDWPDDRAVTILTRCREVLPPGGRVLIVEPVLPEVADTAAGGPYLSDLNMLVNVGGLERTRQDFEELCLRAGLTVASVTALPKAPPFSVIEATAAR
ncbi:methyltransferase [Streptomyces sp. NPDC021093]|uniref:methyltransferase n=1 Tax=Streptomyces sp. NPDC021093 TaxID=3365112 RepID=UPI0037BC0CAF